MSSPSIWTVANCVTSISSALNDRINHWGKNFNQGHRVDPTCCFSFSAVNECLWYRNTHCSEETLESSIQPRRRFHREGRVCWGSRQFPWNICGRHSGKGPWLDASLIRDLHSANNAVQLSLSILFVVCRRQSCFHDLCEYLENSLWCWDFNVILRKRLTFYWGPTIRWRPCREELLLFCRRHSSLQDPCSNCAANQNHRHFRKPSRISLLCVFGTKLRICPGMTDLIHLVFWTHISRRIKCSKVEYTKACLWKALGLFETRSHS